jgi:hypothetical protein
LPVFWACLTVPCEGIPTLFVFYRQPLDARRHKPSRQPCSAPHAAGIAEALGVGGFPDTKMPFSPTVRDRGFPVIFTTITGLREMSSEGRMANRPGRIEKGLKEIMQDHQAVCLEVREPELRCPGAEFSSWEIDRRGNRVAAVACAGAGFSLWKIEVPIPHPGIFAMPALGSVLPVLWMPEASWPATLQRGKARNDGNSQRRKAAQMLC